MTVANREAPLKRKREHNEEIDLYGEPELTEKKPRVSNEDAGTYEASGTGASIPQAEAESEESEGLLFLVSQEGDFQVNPVPNPITIDPSIE